MPTTHSFDTPVPIPQSGIQTLDKSWTVIQLISASANKGMTVTQLEEASSLSTPTLYRLLQALRQLGIVRQQRSRGPYYLGHQLIIWGNCAEQTQGLRQKARQSLQHLADTYQDSFYLFIPDGDNVLCLDIQEGRYPARSYAHHIGGRIRHGIGQASIAILSHIQQSEFDQILSNNMPILKRRFGISLQDVNEAVTMCRHLQVTSGVEGTSAEDYTGLASPILDKNDRAIAALSCSVQRHRMTDAHYHALCQTLKQQTQQLQTLLNHADNFQGFQI